MISYLLSNGKTGNITDPAVLRNFYYRIWIPKEQRKLIRRSTTTLKKLLWAVAAAAGAPAVVDPQKQTKKNGAK